jgi:hypothetical protein
MIFAAAAFYAMVLGVPPCDAGAAPAVRVYVFTAEAGGQPTDDEKGRLDAVQDLRDALSKKKELQVVTARTDADVIVEVLSREVQDAGEGGFGGAKLTTLANTIIRVRASHASGGEGSELKGMGMGSHAAKDAADRILKWVQRDQPTPAHKRGKDMPPSTVMTLPVAYGASPRNSAATTRATSSGVPQRFSGTSPSAMRRS